MPKHAATDGVESAARDVNSKRRRTNRGTLSKPMSRLCMGLREVLLASLFPPIAVFATYGLALPVATGFGGEINPAILLDALLGLVGASFCFSLAEMCLEEVISFIRSYAKKRYICVPAIDSFVFGFTIAWCFVLDCLCGVYDFIFMAQNAGELPTGILFAEIVISIAAVLFAAYGIGNAREFEEGIQRMKHEQQINDDSMNGGLD